MNPLVPDRAPAGIDVTRPHPARMVYADNDPVIHAHANALLTGTGTTKTNLADLCEPRQIIIAASSFLDFTCPVALLLVAIMHFHGTADFHSAEITTTAAAYNTATAPLVLRPRAAVRQQVLALAVLVGA